MLANVTAEGVAVVDSPVAATASFRRFYDANFRGVLGLTIALTGDRWASEDLTQEAFTRAYRDWATVGGYERPDAWVRRVAVNLAMSRGRRLTNEVKALTRLRNRPQPVVATLAPQDEEFWRAVRALPPKQAQAVALHYVEDLSVAAVAEVMGVGEGAVKTHLFRARKTLAAKLKLQEGDA